jgi:DNA replication protein DnaC
MNELFEQERTRRLNQSRERGLAHLSELMKKHASVQKPTPTTDEIETPEPRCKTCNNRGWIAIRNGDRTRHIHCPDDCHAAARIKAQHQKAQRDYMMAQTKRQTPPLQVALNTYTPRNENQDRAYEVACKFCEDKLGLSIDGQFKKSLVYIGEYGSGKTHLVSGLYHQLEGQGVHAWYMKFGEMIRYVNNCYDASSSVTPLQAIRSLQYIPLLILDDVGRDNVSGSTMDLFFDIIDARYDADLPTIITTNVNQEQMGLMFGPRLGDRLRHMAHWVRLDGNVRDKTGEF